LKNMRTSEQVEVGFDELINLILNFNLDLDMNMNLERKK